MAHTIIGASKDWTQLADAISATAYYDLFLGHNGTLEVMHNIAGYTGGWTSLVVCRDTRDVEKTRGWTIKPETASAATSGLSVDTNVLTVRTLIPTDLLVGETVIIVGSGMTVANLLTTHAIATKVSTSEYTIALTTANALKGDGTIYRVVETAHPASTNTNGMNIQSGNQTASYLTAWYNVAGAVRLTVTVGGGTHNVYARLLNV
jgi:hypothetical protein